MGGSEGPCAFTLILRKGARLPRLWPKLEKAFHTLPPPAGTSGLVTLPRWVLPEGFLFLYQA